MKNRFWVALSFLILFGGLSYNVKLRPEVAPAGWWKAFVEGGKDIKDHPEITPLVGLYGAILVPATLGWGITAGVYEGPKAIGDAIASSKIKERNRAAAQCRASKLSLKECAQLRGVTDYERLQLFALCFYRYSPNQMPPYLKKVVPNPDSITEMTKFLWEKIMGKSSNAEQTFNIIAELPKGRKSSWVTTSVKAVGCSKGVVQDCIDILGNNDKRHLQALMMYHTAEKAIGSDRDRLIKTAKLFLSDPAKASPASKAVFEMMKKQFAEKVKDVAATP